MHARTGLLLFLVVLALGGVALWQLQHGDSTASVGVRELVPGLKRDAIEALRIDSLERGHHIRIERDGEGLWRLSDPLVFPANVSLLGQLMDALTIHPAEPWEGEPATLGLHPPRVVLEVEQRSGEGRRVRRIELGLVDVDLQHVFLRVDGELVRATSTLNTLLDLPLMEWRQREILPAVSPMTVVSLRRTGQALLPGLGMVDLELEVQREQGWRATRPFVGTLGPEAFGTLLTNLCSLRAAGFESDAPGPLEDYGLEPPDFRVEITTLRGDSHALRFAQRPGSERLLCLREGAPHIFAVTPESMGWLLAPADALADVELARVGREHVARIRLVADGRETLLERRGFAWYVSSKGGSDEELAPQKADGELVSDLLGRIERTRWSEVLPQVEFVPAELPQGVYLETEDEVHGGEIGRLHASARGTQGLLFRRPGETLVGLLEPEILELARTDPRGLRSDELHKVAELDIAQVRVAAGWAQARRNWGRDEKGRWIPEGSTAEARDFARLVDQVLTVRAARLLEPGDEIGGIQPLAVALVDRGGATREAFTLQLIAGSPDEPENAEVLYLSSGHRGLVDGRLYFALRELLGIP